MDEIEIEAGRATDLRQEHWTLEVFYEQEDIVITPFDMEVIDTVGGDGCSHQYFVRHFHFRTEECAVRALDKIDWIARKMVVEVDNSITHHPAEESDLTLC